MKGSHRLVTLDGVNILGRAAYYQRILNTEPANLLGLWRINDATGSAVAVDSSPNGYNGTHNGVTLGALAGPDGAYAGDYDGLNDYTDIYSAGLSAAIDMDEFTFMQWLKVSSAGVWTDGAQRMSHFNFTDGTNFIQMTKLTTNNDFRFRYANAGTAYDVVVGGLTTTEWFHVAITVSATANVTEGYINGVSQGTSTAPAWAAAQPMEINIGSGSGGAFWDGGIALAPMWSKALSAAQIADLAVI